MTGQKVMRRQKDIARLLREKKHNPARGSFERERVPVKKGDKRK
jgi:hypothetical protein